MKKKATVIILALATLLICLLGAFMLVIAKDEPLPDTSDLELTLSPSIEGSFWERLSTDLPQLTREITKPVKTVDSDADTANPHRSAPDIHKQWNMDKMDEALANIPPEFWANLDLILQAPENRGPEGMGYGYRISVFDNITRAEMVKYKALRLAQQGHPDEGLRMAARIISFGKKYCDSGYSLIDLLGGLAIRAIGYTTMGEIVGNHPVSPACLKEMREAVRQSHVSNDAVRNIIKAEFWSMRNMALDPCMHDISALKTLMGKGGPAWTFLSIPYAADICPQAILLRPNETLRLYADWTRETIKWIDYNSQEIRKLALFDHEDAAIEYGKGRFPYDPYNAGGRMALQCVVADYQQGILHRRLEVESMASALEAMLAAREYELQHGTLPESLEKLVPEYLPSVPPDRSDGQPIRYSPQSRVIWAIGKKCDLVEPLPRPEYQDDREGLIFRLLPLTKNDPLEENGNKPPATPEEKSHS